MSSPRPAETEGFTPSSNRGVWGFVKRKVWGDVPSHPISNSGSASRAARPDQPILSPADMSSPQASASHAGSGQSPFGGHAQPESEDQSDEDAHQIQPAIPNSVSNKATDMASEPSLRHGLGEGDARQEGQSGDDAMNRAPSLAAGIGGSGFEWNPNPAKRSKSNPAESSDSQAEPGLTFSPAAPGDEQQEGPIRDQTDAISKSDDISQSEEGIHQTLDDPTRDLQQGRVDLMDDEMGSTMSDYDHQEEGEPSSSFASMQTRAPGLTPLRLTPKSAPAKPRVANRPPPTSFPSGEVAAQGGTTPRDIQQSEEEQQGRHGSDATSRTGAIVDELLHGVVSDNLSTADILNPAVSQPPSHEASQVTEMEAKPHGASQVGPAPAELEAMPHGASEVHGESFDKSDALRIPQTGEEPLAHGALQVEVMPELVRLNTRSQSLRDDASASPRSPSSARSGTAGTPRSPFRTLAGYAETAIGLTGGAVAGVMAGSALVGIGAAALTGGAVLNAMHFPRSAGQAVSAGSTASDAHTLTDIQGAQQEQQPGTAVVTGPNRLERLSSSAKRHADSSWASSDSPHKRQEIDQPLQAHASWGPDSQATPTTADSGSGVTHADQAEAAAAADSQSVGDDSADSESDEAQQQGEGAESGGSLGSGLASYKPGTASNRPTNADQRPDSYDSSAAAESSHDGGLGSHSQGAETSTAPRDSHTSKSEDRSSSGHSSFQGGQGQAMMSEAETIGRGSSRGAILDGYMPHTGPDNPTQRDPAQAAAAEGVRQEDYSSSGAGPASYPSGTSADRASQAEQGQASDSEAANEKYGSRSDRAPASYAQDDRRSDHEQGQEASQGEDSGLNAAGPAAGPAGPAGSVGAAGPAGPQTGADTGGGGGGTFGQSSEAMTASGSHLGANTASNAGVRQEELTPGGANVAPDARANRESQAEAGQGANNASATPDYGSASESAIGAAAGSYTPGPQASRGPQGGSAPAPQPHTENVQASHSGQSEAPVAEGSSQGTCSSYGWDLPNNSQLQSEHAQPLESGTDHQAYNTSTGEALTSNVTASHAKPEHTSSQTAQDSDSHNSATGRFFATLARYAPGREASKESQPQPSHISDYPSSGLRGLSASESAARFTSGTEANTASQAGHSDISDYPSSGSHGLSSDESAARFMPGTAAQSGQDARQSSSHTTGSQRSDSSSGSFSASHDSGTEASRAASHRQQTQEPRPQGSGSEGDGGRANHMPDTEAGAAPPEEQGLGPHTGSPSGPVGSAGAAGSAGAVGPSMSSSVDGNTPTIKDNRFLHNEQVQAASDEAVNQEHGSSTGRDAAGDMPGSEANRSFQQERGGQAAVPEGITQPGERLATSAAGVEANLASQSEPEHQPASDSGNQGYSSRASEGGRLSDMEQSQAPALFSGYYGNKSSTGSSGDGPASYIPARRASRESHKAEQGPSAETGSAGAQDSVSDSEVSTGADSEALAQRHTLAETQTQDAEGQRPSAEPGTIKEGRSEQAARDADEQARGWQNASGQQPGVTEGHIPDAERSSTYYNDSEWAEPEHHKSSLNEPPMPTVAEEPMAEEAAVEATQPKESGEQQTQAHNTHAQGTLALPQDIQLHESEPETREAQSLQTQPHQTQAQQQHAREEPEAEASPSGVHDESGAQPQPERPHHSLAGRLFGLIGGGQGQPAAANAAATQGDLATVDAPEEPALKSDIGQQQAVAVEGPALEHGQSSDRSVATDDAPEEPTLESGLAQQAAAAEQEKDDSDTQNAGFSSRTAEAIQPSQSGDAQAFASQHHVNNVSPSRQDESNLVGSRISDSQRSDTQRPQSEAYVPSRPQTDDTQSFVSQHQVSNQALGGQDAAAMFAEPLSSHSLDGATQQTQSASPSSDRPQTDAAQMFAGQPQVDTEASGIHEEAVSAEPLQSNNSATDTQHDNSPTRSQGIFGALRDAVGLGDSNTPHHNRWARPAWATAQSTEAKTKPTKTAISEQALEAESDEQAPVQEYKDGLPSSNSNMPQRLAAAQTAHTPVSKAAPIQEYKYGQPYSESDMSQRLAAAQAAEAPVPDQAPHQEYKYGQPYGESDMSQRLATAQLTAEAVSSDSPQPAPQTQAQQARAERYDTREPPAQPSQSIAGHDSALGQEPEHLPQSLAGRLFGLIGGHHSQEQAPTQDQEEEGHAEPTEEHMATDDIPDEPALQSSVGQKQAAAVEGQAAGHDGSSKEAIATEDVLKEPLLESGAAQQAAAAEEEPSFESQAAGSARKAGQDGLVELSTERPQTSDTQAFASQHEVRNEAPDTDESSYAKLLTSDHQASGSQEFSSRHQISNQAPAAQEEAMFAQPLSSDNSAADTQHEPTRSQGLFGALKDAVGLGDSRTPPFRPAFDSPPSKKWGQTSEAHDGGQAPVEEHRYGQPYSQSEMSQRLSSAQPAERSFESKHEPVHEHEDSQSHGNSEMLQSLLSAQPGDQAPTSEAAAQQTPAQGYDDRQQLHAESSQASVGGDSTVRHEPEHPHQSLAGRLFGLLAQGQTQAEEQAARHSDNSEAPSATAGAPEEPALQSEVGQQQAAAVEGRAARQPESDETPAAQEGALLPGMAQYAPSIQHEEESQPQPQSFASQHHTLAPGSEHSRSATPPLISGDHRAAAHQHDPEATPAGDQPSFRGDEASDTQAFVSQHQVNHETPGDAESMLAQPLTSDGRTPGAQLAQNSDIGSTQDVGQDTQQSESQSTHKPHESLTGRLMNTLFGGDAHDDQTHDSPAATSGTSSHVEAADTTGQAETALVETADQSTAAGETGQQLPAHVEEEGGTLAAQSEAEEEDGSRAKTEADLRAAQQAQREALQAEQESLAESQQSLMQVKEALQHEQESSAAPEYSLGPAPSQSEEEGDGGRGGTDADLAAAQRAQREALQAEQESVHSSRQGLLEVREALQHQQDESQGMTAAGDTHSQAGTDEDGDMAEADADLASAQQAQRGAMLVGQNSLNDSRKRLMEVREAMQQHGQGQAGQDATETETASQSMLGQPSTHQGSASSGNPAISEQSSRPRYSAEEATPQYEQAPSQHAPSQLAVQPQSVSAYDSAGRHATFGDVPAGNQPNQKLVRFSDQSAESASAGLAAAESVPELSSTRGSNTEEAPLSTDRQEPAAQGSPSGGFALRSAPPSSLWGRPATAVDTRSVMPADPADADRAVRAEAGQADRDVSSSNSPTEETFIAPTQPGNELLASHTLPTDSAPPETAAAESAPVESAPVESAAAESTQAESAPLESALGRSAAFRAPAVQSPPSQSPLAELAPVKSSLNQTAAVQSAPAQSAPTEPGPGDAQVVGQSAMHGAENEVAACTTSRHQPVPQRQSSTLRSAPPSSLWGPPAAGESQTARLAGNAGTDSAVSAEAEHVPPIAGQEGYYGLSNRPGSHVTFARGNVNPKPARLRPSLPQDWVQAVGERADSSTPTSARSIPDTTGPFTTASRPTPGSGTRQTTANQTPNPTHPNAGAPASAPVASVNTLAAPASSAFWHTSSRRPSASWQNCVPPPAAPPALPRTQLPYRSIPAGQATPQLDRLAQQTEEAREPRQTEQHDPVAVQQAAARNLQGWQHAGLGGSVAPVTPQAANATPPQPVAQHTVSVEDAPQLVSTSTDADAVPAAEQRGARDAVQMQQAAVESSQGGQHAGFWGSVSPVGAQAGGATPPQPVAEALPQAPASAGVTASDEVSAGTAEADFGSAVHAEPAKPAQDLNAVSRQSDVSASTAATAQAITPAAATTPAEAYDTSSQQAQIPLAASSTDQAHMSVGKASKGPVADTLPNVAALATEPETLLEGGRDAASTGVATMHSAAMTSLDVIIPPPFEYGSSVDAAGVPAYTQPVSTLAPPEAAFQTGRSSEGTSEQQSGNTNASVQSAFQNVRPSDSAAAAQPEPESASGTAPSAFDSPVARDSRRDNGSLPAQGRQMLRQNTPEVHRQIDQTAAEVQEVVNERGRGQATDSGDQEGPQAQEALARATGTLKALVAGHLEEAESLSRGLPTYSGPTENYPSERQAAALRSVDGTTRAAKAASLERGVQAAFAIPTADRAAAMLKALAIGKPLDKMESVPEASLEGVPSADRLQQMGFRRPSQVSLMHRHQEGSEADQFEDAGSELSFVSAVSQTAPGGSIASDMDYASVVDEPMDQRDGAANHQGWESQAQAHTSSQTQGAVSNESSFGDTENVNPSQASSSIANKIFMSSKALSEAVFGTTQKPNSPPTAQRPTSPFAEANPTVAPHADLTSAQPGSSNRSGECGSTEQQRIDGTPRNSLRAVQIEEALMSSASPFSRRLSSEEVKPVVATLAQGSVREEEVPAPVATATEHAAQSQGAKGPSTDEIQPADTASGGAATPQTAARPTTAQAADDGKARFVCCGFGGKKSNRKQR